MSSKYDNIINLPHHTSKNHCRMSMQSRAAQFAPFAALNGHEEAIEDQSLKNDEYYAIRRDLDEIETM